MSNADAERERALQQMIDAMEANARNRTNDEYWVAWQQATTNYWLLIHPDDVRFRRGDPTLTPTINHMQDIAARIASNMKGAPTPWRRDPRSPERALDLASVGWLHELMASLYGPVGHSLERLRHDDNSGVETLIRFLEADVYCWRSGYVKADVIRFLTRTALDPSIEKRLRHVVLATVDGPDRREFRAYVRLARRVDSEDLRRELASRAESSPPLAARHARWILAGLDADGTGGNRMES